jgi:hypothetical protein
VLLLKAVVALTLASEPTAKPAASAGCATTNILTALKHMEAHLKATPSPQAKGAEETEEEAYASEGWSLAESLVGKTWTVSDVPNGYVSEGEAGLGDTYEAALFKNPEGYHLVLVGFEGSSVNTAVFRCTKAGLKQDPQALKVTDKEILQLYSSAGLMASKGKKGFRKELLQGGGGYLGFHLPRKGRSIRISSQMDEEGVYGKQLGSFEYVDSKFVVVPLKKK